MVGLAESFATRYKGNVEGWLHQGQITGLNRAAGFLVILLVLVIRGRGLPLRSHVADRLPKLGTGELNVRALLLAAAVTLALLLGVFDASWAAATYVSLAAGVMILSIVVLTGYAGQLSLAPVGARRHRCALRRPARAGRVAGGDRHPPRHRGHGGGGRAVRPPPPSAPGASAWRW